MKPEDAAQITAALEIKGTAGTQRIPLEVHSEWVPDEQLIDWPAIGEVKEVVLLLNNRASRGESAAGSLLIDARFERLTVLRRLSLSPGVRFTGVLLAGLLAAFVTALLRSVLRLRSEAKTISGIETFAERTNQARSNHWPQLLQDLVRSLGIVLLCLLVIEVFQLGSRNVLETGWTAVGLALAGAGLAEWWKAGLTGQHLTVREAFLDTLATGLLATSSSGLAILQAPASWPEMVLLSQTVAAAAILVYHATNAYRLAASGRHLGPTTAALIVGTPYVVGGLVLLESNGLLQSLGTGLTFGLIGAQSSLLEFFGRVVVVFCFNEAVARDWDC